LLDHLPTTGWFEDFSLLLFSLKDLPLVKWATAKGVGIARDLKESRKSPLLSFGIPDFHLDAKGFLKIHS
jgi:hypothetical protein